MDCHENEIDLPVDEGIDAPSDGDHHEDDFVITPTKDATSPVTPSTSPAASSVSLHSSAGTSSSSCSRPKRMRLRGKTPPPKQPQSLPPGLEIGGHALGSHPLLLAYRKTPVDRRRTIRKRVWMQRHRWQQELKKNLVVVNGDRKVEAATEAELPDAIRELDGVVWDWIARDTERAAEDRGYAMDQLAAASQTTVMFTEASGARRIGGVPSVLLTYQGPFGVIEEETVRRKAESSTALRPHGGAALDFFDLDLDVVAGLLVDHPKVKALHAQLEKVAVFTCNKLHTPHYAYAIELCGKTFRTLRVIRVHAHMWLSLSGQTLHLEHVELGTEPSAKPFINYRALAFFSNGPSRSVATNMAGAFYCTIKKVGSVLQEATLHPWADYQVRDTWITGLFVAGKITVDTARAAYVKTVSRCENNVSQLNFVVAQRRLMEREEMSLNNEAQLRETLKPWKHFEAIAGWRRQYDEFKGRYLFLVLDGPSSTGKSRFALAQAPVGHALYSDCTMGVPNLRGFDRNRHALIVLDELSPEGAITYKKLMQCSNEPVTLGSSPTMAHAYEVHVHRAMLIVCSNEWAVGLRTLPSVHRDWLVHNSVHVQVLDPMWEN